MSELFDGDANGTAGRARASRRDFLRAATVIGTVAMPLAQVGCASPPATRFETSDQQCRDANPHVTPAYPLDAALLASFVRASEALTGLDALDVHLAREYLERMATHPSLSAGLPKLLDAVERAGATAGVTVDEAKIASTVMDDAALRPLAQQLIYLWYVSALYLPNAAEGGKPTWAYGTTEQYEQALLWPTIRAHVPMVSGGAYGYWASAPVAEK
jgi:hypothetical protein